MVTQLVTGDSMPPVLAADLESGERTDLTAVGRGYWTAILLYRGDW